MMYTFPEQIELRAVLYRNPICYPSSCCNSRILRSSAFKWEVYNNIIQYTKKEYLFRFSIIPKLSGNPGSRGRGICFVILVGTHHLGEPPRAPQHPGLPGDRFRTKRIAFSADNKSTRLRDSPHRFLLFISQGSSYAR